MDEMLCVFYRPVFYRPRNAVCMRMSIYNLQCTSDVECILFDVIIVQATSDVSYLTSPYYYVPGRARLEASTMHVTLSYFLTVENDLLCCICLYCYSPIVLFLWGAIHTVGIGGG